MCVRLHRIHACGHKTDLGIETCSLWSGLPFHTRKCPAFVPRERYDLTQPASLCPGCLEAQRWARAVGLVKDVYTSRTESVVKTLYRLLFLVVSMSWRGVLCV